jgi:hypothetical protein
MTGSEDIDGDDWGPFGPALREALIQQGIDPTGKTLAQAALEAGVITGQVRPETMDKTPDPPPAEEPVKFPWEEPLPVDPPDDLADGSA